MLTKNNITFEIVNAGVQIRYSNQNIYLDLNSYTDPIHDLFKWLRAVLSKESDVLEINQEGRWARLAFSLGNPIELELHDYPEVTRYVFFGVNP